MKNLKKMEQIKKSHNDFVISISAPTIDITNVNIEETQQYSTLRNRMSCIVTEKKTYGELERMNYQLVFNYSKPKVMAINTKNKPYLEVFQYLLGKFKKGLLLVETDTYSEAISDLLCTSQNVEKNDIDIMICKNSLGAMTIDEMKKANYLRISADPNVDAISLQKIQNFYREKGVSILLCQMFVNEQYEIFKNFINEQSEKYSQAGKTEFVDYYELNKQMAYFVYFDVANNKILNVSRQVIKDFATKMKKQGALPLPDSIFEEFINEITVS